jgi:DNA-binding NarL/FixJ family response regulator
MSAPRIRILCVDDHRIVREGLVLILGRQPDMEVVGAAASGQEAVRSYRQLKPDVTLMDLQLGEVSGLDAIRAIKRDDPDARIVVLTMYQGDEDIFRSLEAGATTYLLKDTLSDDLVRVVRQIHAGEHPAMPEVEARLAERRASPTLTPREIQVMELLKESRRNRDIAAKLGISEETVHVHVRNILMKLNVSDRSGAITVALRRGIIHL